MDVEEAQAAIRDLADATTPEGKDNARRRLNAALEDSNVDAIDAHVAETNREILSGDTPHEAEREEASEQIAEAAADAAVEHAEEALETAAEVEEAIGEAEEAIPDSVDPEARAAVLNVLETLADEAEREAALSAEAAAEAVEESSEAEAATTPEATAEHAEVAQIEEEIAEEHAENVADAAPVASHPFYRPLWGGNG
jgi:hypothetical protein